MIFHIEFKNRRAIAVRGARLAATHRDYGPTTYIEDNDGKNVFQCNSEQLSSVVERPEALEGSADSLSGNASARAFRVLFRNGKVVDVQGRRLSFTHRDYGPRTYVENDSGAEVFQANSNDLLFVCLTSALVSDEGDEEPPAPCEDTEAFVFISYKREDLTRICPYLKRLHEWGYDIWYDRGIPGGSEWDAMIEDRVANCQALLVFLSQDAADSKWVRREIKFADSKNKPILVVRMGQIELRDGLNITLSQYQMISETAEDFGNELKRAIEYVRLL